MVVGEDPALVVFRATCLSKDAPAGAWVWECRACCKCFQSPLGVLCCSLKSVTDDGPGGKRCCPLSFLEWGVFTQHCFRKSSERENSLPFCVPSFHQVSAFTLCSSCLPARQYCTPVFYVRCLAGFQTPNFRELGQHGPTRILWGRVSPLCGWCQFVPEKQP